MFILGFSHCRRLQYGVSCISGIKIPTEQGEGCMENIGRGIKEYIIIVDGRSGTQDRTMTETEPGTSVDSKCQQGSERLGRLLVCSDTQPSSSLFVLHSSSFISLGMCVFAAF